MKQQSGYALVTDSAADLTKQQLKKLGVISIPLNLYMKDTPAQPCELEGAAFYAELRAGRTACVSAANLSVFRTVFGALLEQGQDIVYLSVSAALSCMHATAQIAAAELKVQFPERKIIIIDTRCTGMGQGMLVSLAAMQQATGVAPEALSAYVTENRLRLCHLFAVAGRRERDPDGKLRALRNAVYAKCGRYAVRELNGDGKLVTALRLHGKKQTLLAIVRRYEAECTDKNAPVCIAHSDARADAELLRAMLHEHGAKHILIGELGPVTGVCIGAGAAALFYLGEMRA